MVMKLHNIGSQKPLDMNKLVYKHNFKANLLSIRERNLYLHIYRHVCCFVYIDMNHILRKKGRKCFKANLFSICEQRLYIHMCIHVCCLVHIEMNHILRKKGRKYGA